MQLNQSPYTDLDIECWPAHEGEPSERKNYQMQVARMAQHLSRFELENQKLAEIAKRADLDGLTGCLNREGWERLSIQEFSRLKRQLDQTTSTLLMLDIDRFKQVNDNYGHLVGDKVLKQVVKIAQQPSLSQLD